MMSSISLSWAPPDVGGGAAKVLSYNVSWKGPHGQTGATTNQTKLIIDNLESNAEYEVIVTAKSDRGEFGDQSDPVTQVTCKLLYYLRMIFGINFTSFFVSIKYNWLS